MFKEFREFAFKGNMIDMAVGIIIGGAFGTVVKSLVDNIFMPPLGWLTANIDFSELKLTLKDASAGAGAESPELAIGYGQFIQDLFSFALVAIAVFIIVKKALGAMKKQAREEPPTTAISPEEKLLTEIRDLLAKQQQAP